MSGLRGISTKEQLEQKKRRIEAFTRPKKSWGETKFKGRYVCAVCGEYITPKKGEKKTRHEKKTIILGRDKKDTFWTYRHATACPKRRRKND